MYDQQTKIDALFKEMTRLSMPNRIIICGPSRRPSVVHARAVAVAVMHGHLEMSWPQIGIALDHAQSTVFELHRSRRHDRRVLSDATALSETLRTQFCQPASGEFPRADQRAAGAQRAARPAREAASTAD